MVSGAQKNKKRRQRDDAPTAGPSNTTSADTDADAVPSEPKHSCDDTEASEPSITNEENAARPALVGYVPTFDGQEALPPSLAKTLGERRAAELLHSVVENAVNLFSILDVAKEFEGHRAVIQRVFGEERACKTLKDFVRANTKVIPLNIWDPPPGDHEMYQLGSANPLTVYYVRCHAPNLRPQTSDPSLIDFHLEAYSTIQHGAALYREGEWFCVGVLPEPIEGMLQPEEQVWSLVAVYTSPIPTPPKRKCEKKSKAKNPKP